MKKSEIKKMFLAINPKYKVSLKRHPLIENAVSLFVDEDSDAIIGNFNVVFPEKYNAHKEAYQLASKLHGTILSSGEKLISSS